MRAHVQALQAQNLMWAPAGVTFSMFFVNIAFNSILVSNYGFTGAAYAQSASRIAQFLLLAGAAPPDPASRRDTESQCTERCARQHRISRKYEV